MPDFKQYIFPAIFVITVISSCNRLKEPRGMVEADYIKYQVEYLNDMAGDIPTKMLPDVLEAYYTDRYILTEINGFFGQFSLVMVADLRKNNVTTMLNFFGNKVSYRGKRGEIPAGIKELVDPDIIYTDDTTSICNMLSKKAVVKTEDASYDVYYVEDINIEAPNITTPYNFIDYVLSDFRVQLSELKMHLVMYDHEETTIDASIFSIPEEYVSVSSRESMESIINSLFTKD